MPTKEMEKNQLIIKMLFLLMKNNINSSIFRNNEEAETEAEDRWKDLKTKELSELQEIYHELATMSSVNNNKHKQVPIQHFNYDNGNYGIFGMITPLINLVKSLFGANNSNVEGGFIGQLHKSFSNIRIALNPETSLTLEEKESSKYGKLFNMAAVKQYKSFNKHYRELVKNNFTEKQILNKFFQLIADDTEVESKRDHFLLFQSAEKELLGGKITAENMSEILSKRVEDNLNKVLKVYLVISDKPEDELNDLQQESEKKIAVVKIIIKNLVDKIIEKEKELEKFRLENKSEEYKIKYELYQSISKYKKKLYSFILRTDAWGAGETLHQDKVFDIDYIKKQFDKFPNKRINYSKNKIKNYKFHANIKDKGILKLFENDTEKLKKDTEYQENIKICKKEKIKENLLNNISASIKSFNCLSGVKSGKDSEIQALESIFQQAQFLGTIAPQAQSKILETVNKYSRLTGDAQEIFVNMKDFQYRIISLLCDYYKMENIAESGVACAEVDIKEKTKEFIQHLSPTIMYENLDDIIERKFAANTPQTVTDSINDDDVGYFNTLEKLKFFASQLKEEVNTFVNFLKVDNKPSNIRASSFSRPGVPVPS